MIGRARTTIGFALLNILGSTPAWAATLEVGPGKPYATPCAAIAAASAGDTIEADAEGTYTGDTCSWTTDNLTVRAVNGMAKIDVTGGAVADDKGIFVIYATNATIEGFELSGAAVTSDEGNNGAGIRHQGTNLTVRNCYIHDNQNGILGNPFDASGNALTGQGTVLIENSEFSHNGAGDGESHNMYLGKYATFTLHFSYSHDANQGHLVKSRAYTSFIEYNRLTDEVGGMASYEVDLPVGGAAYVIGNIIEQSPTPANDNILSYGEEPGNVIDPDTHLLVVNNTFLNDYGKGTFVHVDPGITTPALVENNIFEGGGTDCDETDATLTTNFDAPASGSPGFVAQATYDVELTSGSPCIDKGTIPGSYDGVSLAPTYEYVQPENGEPRLIEGAAIDIGAYEYGNPDGGLSDSGIPTVDAGAASSGSVASKGDGGEANSMRGSSDADTTSRARDADSGTESSGRSSARGSQGDAGSDTEASQSGANGSGGCGCVASGRSDVGEGGLLTMLTLVGLSLARGPRRRPRSQARGD